MTALLGQVRRSQVRNDAAGWHGQTDAGKGPRTLSRLSATALSASPTMVKDGASLDSCCT
ncbi:hypothetical protein GGR13_000791 [Brevundimonas variabilis]|uniref:Uncharacterized protein n=1 Tax=Brevundimonas variabilis TaxID=74312 RepID=A0A7W9CGM7_9CAUL|nr:hypothetical protein [Brevundimonas variabilis]